MWQIEYSEDENKYWFIDKNGKIRKYSSYNRAKLWRARLIVVQDLAIAALYYDSNGNSFGLTTYEQMYADDDQAKAALSHSGGKCVLRWMMHDFDDGPDSKFDAIVDLNNCPKGFDEGWSDGYTVNRVLENAGMKIIKVGKWIGNKDEYRIVRDSDASSENATNFNNIFGIDTE